MKEHTDKSIKAAIRHLSEYVKTKPDEETRDLRIVLDTVISLRTVVVKTTITREVYDAIIECFWTVKDRAENGNYLEKIAGNSILRRLSKNEKNRYYEFMVILQNMIEEPKETEGEALQHDLTTKGHITI